MAAFEHIQDPIEIDIRGPVNNVVSNEDPATAFLVGYGIPLAIMAYGKLADSSGGKQYSRALSNFKDAQKTNFRYGIEDAIAVSDTKKVIQYLVQHSDTKYKAIFKAVSDMINERNIHLNLKDDKNVIAAFIAEDMKRYPELRPSFTFRTESSIINTNNAVYYDKTISLLDEMIYDAKYGPWNALTKGWERTKDRVANLYTILTDQVKEGTVRDTFDIKYDSKNISMLSMIEARFSDHSFFKRKNHQLDSFFIRILPHFSKDAKDAKKLIAKFYGDVADIYKELINSNKLIANTALGHINTYQEELIKLTKSKDFKIR